MATYLLVIAIIGALLGVLLAVERFYRRFAARNPQLGPFRKPESACGACSGCGGEACKPPR